MEPVALNDVIRMMRIEKGWTLREAASRLEITHAHLSNIESGKATFSMELLERMALVFGENPYIRRYRGV